MAKVFRKFLTEDDIHIAEKQYLKEFSKSDFTQVGSAQRYFLSITQKEHGLTNPYVAKIILNQSNNNEDEAYATPIVCSERLLSTGTIKIYITVDLSEYTDYIGKIYLKGE